MILALCLAAPLALPIHSLIEMNEDPIDEVVTNRYLECRRLAPGEARRQLPGRLAEERPRGSFFDESVMICRERIMRPGERDPRDDAILGRLTSLTDEIANMVVHLKSTSQKTWMVEVHYPTAAMTAKIGFATKAALLRQGAKVTDRIPALSAGDIGLIAETPPLQAYALACRRYFASPSVGSTDAVLSVGILDPRETLLHAGVCVDGEFRWLQ